MWASLVMMSLVAAGCDPGDGPPPASAQNDSTEVPPPPPPPGATAPDPNAQADGDAQYASGEVAVGENTDAYDDDDPSALTDFHAALDPYGSWVDDPTYGTVWVPATTAVGADFTPYATAGHWTYDDDWVWESDYPWGWAPFHYGRWVFIEGRGWAWIPGRVYRGAWVAWGVDDGYGYVGWAPLGPAFVWFGGRPVVWRTYVAPRWAYCSRAEVFSAHVGARILAGPAAARVSERMHTYVTATPGVSGPAPSRLGYSPSQVPHPTGPGAQSVARAQAFARPSTAQALGGSLPSRAAAEGSSVQGMSRPSLGASTTARGASTSTERTPSVTATRSARATASPSAARSAPAVRAQPAGRPSFGHSGGGHHR